MSEVIPNVGTPFHKTCPHDNKMTHKQKICFADIKKIKMYCMHNKCNIFSSCSLPGNELDPPPPPRWPCVVDSPPPPPTIPSVCAHEKYITFLLCVHMRNTLHIYIYYFEVSCICFCWPCEVRVTTLVCETARNRNDHSFCQYYY